jgi:hypothetical protein
MNDLPPFRYDHSQRCVTRCQADDSGDCECVDCPQLRDKEPKTTGRHCPLDSGENRRDMDD